jgi:uncharacterized DUF497 family protein
MFISYVAACALGIITTGCSTIGLGPDNKDNKMIEVPKNKVDNIPEWFLTQEVDNEKDITVTATDVSKDMQFAIDKASLNAQVQIAERLGLSVDSLKKESALESGVGVKDVEREIDRVSKVRVKQDLSFFRRERVAVVKEKDYYRAFVMFKISRDEGRRIVSLKTSNKQTREDKFKVLDEPKQETTITKVE